MIIFRGRLDELKLFLESELWVLCPIRANFTVDILRVHINIPVHVFRNGTVVYLLCMYCITFFSFRHIMTYFLF